MAAPVKCASGIRRGVALSLTIKASIGRHDAAPSRVRQKLEKQVKMGQLPFAVHSPAFIAATDETDRCRTRD